MSGAGTLIRRRADLMLNGLATVPCRRFQAHRGSAMIQTLPVLLILGLVLGVVGCESKDLATSQSPISNQTPADDTSHGAAPSASRPFGETPELEVSVVRSPEYGAYLADTKGRAVYMLEQDVPGGSSCYETCVAIWPPFLSGERLPASADSAVKSRLLGTLPRRDGRVQVAYNGHALYYYRGDGALGEARGQHVEDSWGEWYLMSPEGRPAEGSPWQRRKR